MKSEYNQLIKQLRAQRALSCSRIEYVKECGEVDKVIVTDMYFIRSEIEVINKIIGYNYTYTVGATIEGDTKLIIHKKELSTITLEQEVSEYQKNQGRKSNNYKKEGNN